jgi:xyloglucan-specific exo-beta-1,4-glucanase
MKFYGFSNGRFYVSTNGGANFTATAATGLPGFARIKALPGRKGEIWLAGGDSGLWHSTDSGATFTKLGNVEIADGIGFGMAAPGAGCMALYLIGGINGIRGIFRSIDAGASWMRINDDQHQYGVTGGVITGDPRVFGRVYFGTNGRGIIRGDIPETPTPTPTPTPGGGTGGVTVTPVVSTNSPWFNEQQIRISNTSALTALTVTIVVQRTTGVSFSGQYNTIGGSILQANTSTATAITYQFTLAAGQTLGPATNRIFAAQMGGTGTVHPATGDTYVVTYSTGGTSFTQTGTFGS